MSIRAQNWAWLQQIAPTVKLLLMALADIADDAGICWPSVALLARKCCVSERTVQRLLATLQRMGLVSAEPRYRSDGSRTSNLYRLQLEGGDKLSPPFDAPCGEAAPDLTGTGDTVVAQTTTDPALIHQKQLPPPGEQECGDRCKQDLIFPKQMSREEIAFARRLLLSLTDIEAQQVLDELAGRLNGNQVTSNPLSYLRGLVKRVKSGEFSPEAGVRVALARKRERELAAMKPASPAPDSKPTADPDEYLNALHNMLGTKPQSGREK